MNKELIYGKDNTERIVSIEVKDGTAELFIESADGTVKSEFRPHKYWLLYSQKHNSKFQTLEGDQHYKYLMEYDSYDKWREIIGNSYKRRYDFFTAHDVRTNFMATSGTTLFKGMKIDDVSVLSFDIETIGLKNHAKKKVLIITNTFRKNGKLTRRLFSVDDYSNDAEMIEDWCSWVRVKDPSIIIGHNIIDFDLPYLQACGGSLDLGRDESSMQILERVRQFRKDASQTYDFNDISIYGRQIVDTKFLAIKHDVQRRFPSYSLKPMIEFLGLQKKGRTFLDLSNRADGLSKMVDLWEDPSMRAKIKAYAEEDADDALKLYDLMMPAFFYYAQSIPLTLQEINCTATGTQLNRFMVRAYLQEGHSIPQASEKAEYEGAISLGFPGIHKNTVKIDILSNYPNIMLQYDVFPADKDPKGYMKQMLTHFTDVRGKNKVLFKETKLIMYEHLSNTGKVVCNSIYGLLGVKGLNFNFPEGAAKVTRIARDILKCAIWIATGKELTGGVSETTEDAEDQSA